MRAQAARALGANTHRVATQEFLGECGVAVLPREYLLSTEDGSRIGEMCSGREEQGNVFLEHLPSEAFRPVCNTWR